MYSVAGLNVRDRGPVADDDDKQVNHRIKNQQTFN